MLISEKVGNSAVLLNGNLQHMSQFKGMSSDTAACWPSNPCLNPNSQSEPICQHAHFCQHIQLWWHAHQFLSKWPCFRAAASCSVFCCKGSIAKKSLLIFPLLWLETKAHATRILCVFYVCPWWHWENPPESRISSQWTINSTYHVASILLQVSTQGWRY